MSRVVFLDVDESKAVASCLKEEVGVSAIERLPSGGVRLVCKSSVGADRMRTVFKSRLIKGDDIARERHRPRNPLW
jgi:hypothetical protein